MKHSIIRLIAVAMWILVASAGGCVNQLVYDAQRCTDLPDKNPNAAIQSCTAVINSGKLSNHDIAAAYAARGQSYSNLKDYPRALQDLTKSIASEPHAEAFNSRGITYDLMRDYASAIQDYDEAIRLRPDFPQAYSNRGLVYAEKGDERKALQDFDKAISLQPGYAEAITNRAGTFLDIGEYDKAIQDWTTDLPLEHDSAAVLHDRAMAYNGKKDYPRALDDLTRAIDMSPNIYAFYYARGATYFNLGQFDLAARDSCKAQSLAQADPLTEIWCFIATSRSGKIPDIEAIKSSPAFRSSTWPVQILQMYAGQKASDEILKVAEKEGKKQLCEAYFFLGEYAFGRGNSRDAKALFGKAVASRVLSTFEYFAARAELDRITPNHPR